MRQVPKIWEDEKKELKMVVVLLLLPLALLLVPASHAQSIVTIVTISGAVSNLTFGSVTVRADATGRCSTPADCGPLAGAGTDSPPFPGVSGNPSVCQFPLTGSASGGTVTLSGLVTQSSTPSFVGTKVVITGISLTGAITFTFGGIPFAGTGTVVITTS